MFNYETFEELINLLQNTNDEINRFNNSLESVFGSDTCVMYFKPYDIICESLIKILKLNGESCEGAEWFVYDGLEQIKNGGTEIEENGKTYKIKTIKDYYDYLDEINKRG